MYIILRLICEILSKIAVKINFLWGRKHGVYEAASFAASNTHHDIHLKTCYISLLLFCIRTSLSVLLSDYLVLTLKFHTIKMSLNDVKNFVNQKALSRKRVKFYHQIMMLFLNYVTATLRPFLRDAAYIDKRVYDMFKKIYKQIKFMYIIFNFTLSI